MNLFVCVQIKFAGRESIVDEVDGNADKIRELEPFHNRNFEALWNSRRRKLSLVTSNLPCVNVKNFWRLEIMLHAHSQVFGAKLGYVEQGESKEWDCLCYTKPA